VVARAQGDRRAVDEDQRIKREQTKAAQHSELLGQHGEDKVGLFLGQEFQVGLRALQESATEQAARAQSDLRLDGVVAGPQGIGFRIQEGKHALALIGVQELPADRYGAKPGHQQHGELPHPHAGDEEHGHADHQQHGARAQVRLLEHEAGRHQDQRHRKDL
jgi:hypothetical protein